MRSDIRAWDERFEDAVRPDPRDRRGDRGLAARDVPQFALTNMPQSKWPDVKAMSAGHFGLSATRSSRATSG
jgi:2-haloacid dehalogenase